MKSPKEKPLGIADASFSRSDSFLSPNQQWQRTDSLTNSASEVTTVRRYRNSIIIIIIIINIIIVNKLKQQLQNVQWQTAVLCLRCLRYLQRLQCLDDALCQRHRTQK